MEDLGVRPSSVDMLVTLPAEDIAVRRATIETHLVTYSEKCTYLQTALTAAMFESNTNNVTGDGGAGPFVFGNTADAKTSPYSGTDLTVAPGYTIGAYLGGGAAKLAGKYSVTKGGGLTQLTFQGQ